MPLYEYQCQTCGNSFEKLRRMQEADRELQCPECGSAVVQRLVSTFAAGGCQAPGGKFT
jgi:putative FmdB family regulatory protein